MNVKQNTTTESIPLCVFAADIHLSLRPPIARSAEKDWLAVQAGYLEQLGRFAFNPRNQHKPLPVIIAGDLFDKPDNPAELVNSVIRHLPENVYAIPGQHDLLHHNLADVRKTSFGTLLEAERIKFIYPGPIEIPGATPIRLHGFPWKVKPIPCERLPASAFCLEIAVIHRYIHTKSTGHPKATDKQRLERLSGSLKGYDVAVFGDNHISFSCKLSHGCRVHNCGGFMRRRRDEIDHRPSVGILMSDGTVKREYLDVSGDKFLDAEDVKLTNGSAGASPFIEELGSLQDAALNFADAVKRAMDEENPSGEVQATITRAMEEGK